MQKCNFLLLLDLLEVFLLTSLTRGVTLIDSLKFCIYFVLKV